MSIEFGILLEGSTITLQGAHRVLLDDDLWPELEPLFHRIEQRTGQELDMYGSAEFSGESLKALLSEISSECSASEISQSAQAFLSELLQIATVAERTNNSLSYFGL